MRVWLTGGGHDDEQSQWHGNQPSKGALIDKELQEEDEAILRRKQDATAGKKF